MGSGFYGPGIYQLSPSNGDDKALNMWGGGKEQGAELKLLYVSLRFPKSAVQCPRRYTDTFQAHETPSPPTLNLRLLRRVVLEGNHS